MAITQADLDKARADGRKEGLGIALKIAETERDAAKKEEGHNLSSSVRERTEVRRKYAEIITAQIRKELYRSLHLA
jgi:hypothetical protein